MSCIFRCPDGKIVLMCKGADSVIKELLSSESVNGNVYKSNQATVDTAAVTGLRTLFLAEKELTDSAYNEWNQRQIDAKQSMEDREQKVMDVDNSVEVELELVGATAIEDKLQEDVADTIEFCKSAGIKVWVLTGDKVETAQNIGMSAGLLDKTMKQYIV